MNATTYTKVKSHRTTSRIWIEGNKLRDAGFNCGQNYEVVDFGDALMLSVSNSTKGRKVSSAKRKGKPRPIIDLVGESVANVFPAGTSLCVTFMQNNIIMEEGTRS